MTSNDFILLALQLAAMLSVAVILGELMRRVRQPAVVGEMFGGILLGPTIFGALVPVAYAWLFHTSNDVVVAREAVTKLGMLLFLFLAGLEIDLSSLRRFGARILSIGVFGTFLPIAAGFGLVYGLPREFWGDAASRHFFAFTLFIGMNLANSANPVIARVLMDLGLLNKPIGTVIMSATVVDDLVNWTLFAIILADIAPSGAAAGNSAIVSTALVVLFAVVVLGVGRALAAAAPRYLPASVAWPKGLVAIMALVVLLAGSAAEALGIHAFLGAFLVGVALGGKTVEQIQARETISRFSMSFFAPLYFVSMGMSTNFIQNFDAALVSVILVAGCISKVGAVLLGAKVAGMPLNREAWAIAFGLNARGATGIILAGVGLTYGVIDERMFVAMVVMALVTSMMSGPMMSHLLAHRRPVTVPHLAPATD